MARKGKPWFRQSKGTWYATVEGRKVSLGVRGEENEADAYRAWHRLMAGLREEKTKPKREPSVGLVIRHFLAGCEGRLKAKTLRIYRYFLKPFRARHGKAKASDLTSTLAEAYSRRRGWSDSTRHAFLGTLATAFRWAVKAKLIAATPLADLELPPKASRGADAVVTPEEHASLVANATPAFSLFLRVLYATGARPGEVASITAENFDAESGVVRLTGHKTAHKGKSRVIYLPADVVVLLEVQRDRYPSGPLLRNGRGNPWSGNAVVKAMIGTRKRAGLKKAIAYGYRHTFATDALANGVPDAQVAELLGHSGTGMLHKHYSHLGGRAKALRDALDRVR